MIIVLRVRQLLRGGRALLSPIKIRRMYYRLEWAKINNYCHKDESIIIISVTLFLFAIIIINLKTT